jgi:hypothetical protein
MGWKIEKSQFNSQLGQGIFYVSKISRPTLPSTQPPIQRTLEALFPGVKRPGHEADHSPPSSAEIKNEWSCIWTPL